MTRSRLLLVGAAMAVVVVACSGGGSHASTANATAVPATTEPPTTIAATTTVAPTTTTTTIAATTTVAPTTTAKPPPVTTAAPKPAVTSAPTPIDAATPEGAPAQRVSRGANGKPIVALSFDAGSDFGFAGQILDYLKAEGIKASFGITGKWAEQNPDTFRRIVNEGHHLINHTYSHQSWTGVSSGRLALSHDARVEELRRADDIFVSLAGKSAKPWFRPPYGDIDSQTEKVLGSEGYKFNAMWTIDSLGWKGLSPEAIAARCNSGLGAGVILLFHVGSQSQDANALPAIIAAIRAAGLQPGTIADVI